MPNDLDVVKNQRPVVAMMWPEYRGRAPFNAGVITRLNESGFSMRCLYMSKVSDSPNYFEQHGIGVFYASTGKRHTLDFPVIWRLARYLKANNVKILHCNHHKATVNGVIAATLAGTPVVFSHVHGPNRTRTFLRRLTNRICFRRVAKVIGVSEATRLDILAGNPFLKPDQVIALPNSVDFDRYNNVSITKSQARSLLGISEEAFVFGTVSRLGPTKGHEYLIKAFAEVKRTVPNARLVIVGSGPLKDQLEKLAAGLFLTDSVLFAGYRTDVPQILRAMDCFVQPSLSEGLPGALLEAMASGLACIGTTVDGIPEALANDRLGFLVKPKDPAGLKEAMLRCANMTKEDRMAMGRCARDHVEKFHHHDQYARRLKQLYNEELARACLAEDGPRLRREASESRRAKR